MIRSLILPLGCVLLLAACERTSLPAVARLSEPELVTTRAAPPPGRDPNACYGQEVTPAVIETVTEQVMMQPAQIDATGKLLYPAVYQTEIHQAIVQQRTELWFEAICTADLTPELVSTLQRALKARGHFRGPITGEMSQRTRRAIRSFQKPQGLNSSILSLPAAKQLGLVAFGPVPPPIPEGWQKAELN